MASPIVKGQAFGTTETVTAAKLQNIVDSASFKDFDGSTEVFNVSGSEDIGTCVLAGGLAVKTSTGQLQLKSQADQTVIGNVSGGSAVPTAVPIVGADGILVNSDSLGTDDTKGATQGNIKAYVDSKTSDPARAYQSLTNSTVSDNVQQNTTGRPLWTSFTLYASGKDINFLLLEVSPNSDMSGSTRIGQSRISSDGSSDSGTQVTGIVPSNYYWKYGYALASGTPTEMVHSSFIL
tara:strand:- start:724 stop:1431 length:708 start_codon:yes stop_codon:yes gene_type:complete